MRKTFIAMAAILFAAVSSNGQTTQEESAKPRVKKQSSMNSSIYKPTTGSFSTELNFNPFKGDLSLNNSLNQIKFRYFTNTGFAWRIGFNASSVDSLVSSKNYYTTSSTNNNYEDKRNSFTLGVNLGFEKHFKGTSRLSPYMGLDLSVTNNWSKETITNGQVVTEYKGTWVNRVPYQYYNGSTTVSSYYTQPLNRAFLRLGLNLVTGFDYYMAKNFFFGYEFNFGFNSTSYKDTDVTVSGSPSSSNNNTDTEDKNNAFSFGPNLMNGIRIGYVF